MRWHNDLARANLVAALAANARRNQMRFVLASWRARQRIVAHIAQRPHGNKRGDARAADAQGAPRDTVRAHRFGRGHELLFFCLVRHIESSSSAARTSSPLQKPGSTHARFGKLGAGALSGSCATLAKRNGCCNKPGDLGFYGEVGKGRSASFRQCRPRHPVGRPEASRLGRLACERAGNVAACCQPSLPS